MTRGRSPGGVFYRSVGGVFCQAPEDEIEGYRDTFDLWDISGSIEVWDTTGASFLAATLTVDEFVWTAEGRKAFLGWVFGDDSKRHAGGATAYKGVSVDLAGNVTAIDEGDTLASHPGWDSTFGVNEFVPKYVHDEVATGVTITPSYSGGVATVVRSKPTSGYDMTFSTIDTGFTWDVGGMHGLSALPPTAPSEVIWVAKCSSSYTVAYPKSYGFRFTWTIRLKN